MDYIDRQELIEFIEEHIQECGESNVSARPIAYGTILGLKSTLSFAQILPSADVAEVKHGEWVSASPCGYYDFYCSCCKEYAITYEDSNYRERYHLTDYCPFCGAIMDGGKAE